jgi:hypothetical protein
MTADNPKSTEEKNMYVNIHCPRKFLNIENPGILNNAAYIFIPSDVICAVVKNNESE